MRKYNSDEEFIAAWQRLGSAKKVAEALKIAKRSVFMRRRDIEARYGIVLKYTGTNGVSKTKVSEQSKAGRKADQLAETRARIYERDIQLECANGVVMIASDCHYWPGMVSEAHKAFCRLAKQLKPHTVILNGDILDGARISRHDRSLWQKLPTVKDEVHAVQDRCAEIERASGKAGLIRTIGNHDARFENYLCRMAPDFEEMMGTTLLDYLPRWRAGWAVHLNPGTDGWVTVRHRPVGGGIHSAYNSTLKSGVHYVHGHLHKLEVKPWSDYRGRRYGIDCGTLAEPRGPQFDYTEAAPLNWASGFAVLTFKNGYLLPPDLCIVERGQAWFRGQAV